MVKILSEFREFASRGNVVDLAVGVIIGAAFGKIVDSLVSDLVMPLIGLVLGNLNFSNLFIVLGQLPPDTPRTLAAAHAAGVPVFAYGNFITVLVNFLILAFVIFMMVKQINQLRRLTTEADETRAAEEPPPVPEDVQLLREIRDCLKTPSTAPADMPPATGSPQA